ncbi:MAG: DUF523 domain-containing protein [Methanocella sp.]
MAAPPPILVSACLAGEACRYDGGSCPDQEVLALKAAGRIVPVCPELLGGLATPRGSAEIVGGSGGDVLDGRARVLDCYGQDVTDAFVAGARQVAALAESLQVREAILKDFSPSCGCTLIYDGSFSRRRVPGEGVLAALLRRRGLRVTPA